MSTPSKHRGRPAGPRLDLARTTAGPFSGYARLAMVMLPVLLLGLAGGLGAEGPVTERGATPSEPRPSAGPAPVVPAGLDDTLQPKMAAVPGPPGPDVRDTATGAPPAAPHRTLVEILEEIDIARREQVTIDVELVGLAGETDAAVVEACWSSGDYAGALERLRRLEDQGLTVGVGVDTSGELSDPVNLMDDVRLGGTRTDARQTRLDYHTSSGNRFAVIRWGPTTGTSVWTVNLSTDNGQTWTETYSFGSSTGLVALGAAVVGDYLYLAYVAGNAPDQARLRRADATTGVVDAAFGYQVVVDTNAAVEEVALASNPDDGDDRIYYAALMADDTVHYLWDAASDGHTFTDGELPAVAQAQFGLDITFLHGMSCTPHLAISYNGSDGAIHVWLRSESGWTEKILDNDAGGGRRTSISAYQTMLLCAYEYQYLTGTGIRYGASYDCGSTWNLGDIAAPDGLHVFGYFEPQVAARGGLGTAVLFQAEWGEFDPAFYRFRYTYRPGLWSIPARFNDFDLYTGSETDAMIVPELTLGIWSVVGTYLSLDPDHRTPYYDTTLDFAFFSPLLLSDGFESGTVGAWTTAVP